MLVSLLCALALSAPPIQTIDGIRPAMDGMVPFAQATAKFAQEEPVAGSKKDYFVIGYFGYKAKFMAPLTNTKYTAGIMGICGTILGLYDEQTKLAIKTAADRVSKGTKDFDTFTPAEREAIGAALTNEKSGMYPLTLQQKDTTAFRDYSAGMALGGLSAYVTLWHISPKHPTLLKYLEISIDSCATQGDLLTDPSRKDLAAGLKGFAKFRGKTMDEPTVREVGKQIELTLIASVQPKYRWTPTAK